MESFSNFNPDSNNILATESVADATTILPDSGNLAANSAQGLPSLEPDLATVEQTSPQYPQLQAQANLYLQKHADELQIFGTSEWENLLTDVFQTNPQFQSLSTERLESLRQDFINDPLLGRPQVEFVEPDVLLDPQGQLSHAAFEQDSQTILLANNSNNQEIEEGIEQELGHWWDLQLHGTSDTVTADGSPLDEGAAYAERFAEGIEGDSLYTDSVYQNDRHQLSIDGQANLVEFAPSDVTSKSTIDDNSINTKDGRYIGNKGNDSFNGTVRVEYDPTPEGKKAPIFTTDVNVQAGQAWPRISEGVANGGNTSNPETVENYIKNPHYIQYDGNWEQGSGKRYNGANIWTNNPNNVNNDGSPKWPFTTEINVWNRAGDGNVENNLPSGTKSLPDYYDSDGQYTVRWKDVEVDGDSFKAYYFLKKDGQIDDMSISTHKILEHIDKHHPNSGLKKQEVIETSIAAEAHAGAKGKFAAEIYNLG